MSKSRTVDRFVVDVVVEVGTRAVPLLFDGHDDWIGREEKMEIMATTASSIRYMTTRRRLGRRKQRKASSAFQFIVRSGCGGIFPAQSKCKESTSNSR
jgi:hypothetical protein